MGTGYNDATGKYAGTTVAGGNQYAQLEQPTKILIQLFMIVIDGGTYTNGLTADADKTLYVPSYFGDMCFNTWLDRQNGVEWRGNF